MKHTIKKVNYKGENCLLQRSYYEHGKRIALFLIAENGEPVAACSVNLPNDPLGDNEIFIKNYSENEGMVEFLLKEGVIQLTGRSAKSGYVTIPICKLNPDWRIKEIEADVVNRSPAVNGIYKWKCDKCGAEWEEPAANYDFTVERKDIPSWGVLCEKCLGVK